MVKIIKFWIWKGSSNICTSSLVWVDSLWISISCKDWRLQHLIIVSEEKERISSFMSNSPHICKAYVAWFLRPKEQSLCSKCVKRTMLHRLYRNLEGGGARRVLYYRALLFSRNCHQVSILCCHHNHRKSLNMSSFAHPCDGMDKHY